MDEKLQQQLDNPQFAQLLNESEEYYSNAPSFYSWDPPNGQHVCLITGLNLTTTESKKLGKTTWCARVPVQIMDGDDEGKTFDLSGAFGWSPPYLAGLKTLASMLADDVITEQIPALDVIAQNKGTVILVETTRTKAKDGSGNVYVNHRPREIMPSFATEGQSEG